MDLLTINNLTGVSCDSRTIAIALANADTNGKPAIRSPANTKGSDERFPAYPVLCVFSDYELNA